MPEELMIYLNLIQIHRNSFDKDFDYEILNSAALAQIIKMNSASISFYREMIIKINCTDIEKKATENIITTLLELINKKKNQNTLLKKIIIQRTQCGEPMLILELTIPIIKYKEGMQISPNYNQEPFIDENDNGPALITVFNQSDAIIYEVDKYLLPIFLKELNNSHTLNQDGSSDKTNLVVLNNKAIDDCVGLNNLDDKISQVENFLENFMISPVAYQVFCEYYKLIHGYFISRRNINESDKVLAIDDFINTLMIYLQDESDAFSHLKSFVDNLTKRKSMFLKRDLLNTKEIQNVSLQNQISGHAWEQIQKGTILELIRKNKTVYQNAEPICLMV